VSFVAITICIASQQVFIVVYFVMTQSGNFWIHPRISDNTTSEWWPKLQMRMSLLSGDPGRKVKMPLLYVMAT
jgi:hypothetical protein